MPKLPNKVLSGGVRAKGDETPTRLKQSAFGGQKNPTKGGGVNRRPMGKK